MPQHATADGRNNVIVQIEGDGNTVVGGLPHLTLVRHRKSRKPRNEIEWLNPYFRAPELLVGRDRELASLQGWLASPAPVSVRVLTGGGGAGKTRLALELCVRIGKDWDAGFVEERELARFQGQQNLADWGWRRPTLVVVDYAAAHAQRLHAWLSELADRDPGSAPPLRLLLLERHGAPGGGWWQSVFEQGGWSEAGVRDLLDPPAPVTLPALPEREQRRELLQALFAAVQPGLSVPAAGARPEFDRRLASLDWCGDPLYLLMAGLLAAQIGLSDALALGRLDLAARLAKREGARIGRMADAHGLDRTLLEHVAACVTLCRGLPRPAALSLIEGEQQALKRTSGGDPARIADALHLALPGPEGAIAAVLPDLIGEALVLAVLARPESQPAPAAVQRTWAHAGLPVIETLIRCVQDFSATPDGRRSDRHAPALGWLEGLVQSLADEVAILQAVASALPQATTVLRPLAAEVERRLAACLQRTAAPTPDLALSLNNLAVRLSALGQREAALEAAREAVSLYRALAASRPDAFTSNLAASLNNLAVRLSALGQREAALEAAREAVDLRRALAASRPDAFTPDLAMSLNNLASFLSDLGQREAALEAAREAVDLRRALAASRPDAFTP
ncbi:tetratricopeptide repeat protein, partial [Plasticicumulans lactativorans]